MKRKLYNALEYVLVNLTNVGFIVYLFVRNLFTKK